LTIDNFFVGLGPEAPKSHPSQAQTGAGAQALAAAESLRAALERQIQAARLDDAGLRKDGR